MKAVMNKQIAENVRGLSISAQKQMMEICWITFFVVIDIWSQKFESLTL